MRKRSPHRASVAIAAAAIAVAVLGTGISPALAQDNGVLDALEGPNPALDSPRAALVPKGDRLLAGIDSAKVTLPTSSTDPVSLTSATGKTLTITLPFTEASSQRSQIGGGLVGYDNRNGSTTVPIARKDGFLQITTVIANQDAPSRYEYKFDLAGGATVEAAEQGAIVRDATGAYVAAVAVPWAVDAAGKNVATRYAIEDGALVQYVNHDELTAYPVVADPSICGNIFSQITTTSEQGQPRYGLYASACGTSIKTGLAFGGGLAAIAIGQQTMINAGWSEAVGIQPALTSKTSLRQQYDCHTIYAAAKNPWNLEKYRPNNAGWPSAPSECNWS